MDESLLDALEDIQHILEDAGPDTKNFLEPILPYTPILFASQDMSVEDHKNIALSPRVMNICREFQSYVESQEYEKAGILELKLRLWTLHLSVSSIYAPPLELPLVREGDDEVQFTRMLNEMLQI
ncbi:hypothetical protein CJU90_3224 [Yarrowia sp. C11]|nr:hypothetical protein CKK34_4671 [Yarrowia sp. E02]KAG5369716.1 hypothetical protein CJU90_3224 [Yarrowia sp. C11]